MATSEFMLKKQAKVEAIERRLLLDYLVRAEWNVSRAAALAELHRSAFQRLLAKRGIKVAVARLEYEQRGAS